MSKNVLLQLFVSIALSAGFMSSLEARPTEKLGARFVSATQSWAFRLRSAHATHVELSLFRTPAGEDAVARYVLQRMPGSDEWRIDVPARDFRSSGTDRPIYYGYRVWGPNWPYQPAWKPGSRAGFIADVDRSGNRFNPNKLLIDPYAREISHDIRSLHSPDDSIYLSGPKFREIDTAHVAPKGILMAEPAPLQSHVQRPFRDEIIYEVHVRGLTMNDPEVPSRERGTFRGAARKAAYLRKLGVTAIEFLPVQETQNDTNDLAVGTEGDNYWGYMTLNYFAPDRRYAADKSPMGPTNEFREMVREFHRHGIKVYIDVVYNHTGEGGIDHRTPDIALLSSFRGIDNQGYYELAQDRRYYADNTGVGNNVNMLASATRDLILDSLQYWHRQLGVDGFRFDLATVLGNVPKNGRFHFDPSPSWSPLQRMVRELPARSKDGRRGVDLIAEPWALGDGTYQVGNFPRGWAEWNGRYRDTFRIHQNKRDVLAMPPSLLATHLVASPYLFRDDSRPPSASVNFLVAHDGFTHRDLYSYNDKVNNRPWPYGPSDGGTDENYSWDQTGSLALQKQAAKNGFTLLMLSHGVPMFTGGDEFFRTQYGNNNAYNLDSPVNWLNWSDANRHEDFLSYIRELIGFRRSHPVFSRAEYVDGRDKNGNGLRDISWFRADGQSAEGSYMDEPRNGFLGYLLDATEVPGESVRAIYVAYNGNPYPVQLTLPAAFGSSEWDLRMNTAAQATRQIRGNQIVMPARTITVWTK